jgi:hypothetical protein
MRTFIFKSRPLWILIFLFISATSHAGPTYAVFEDAFGSGWLSQPWGATVSTSSSFFKGAGSVKVVYSSAMGVFKPVASGGFRTTGYKDLVFAVYNSSNADDLWFVAQRTDGVLGTYLRVADYSDKGVVSQGAWTWVRIPISAFGLGTEPKLSFFSVASGKANAIAYFDEVGFMASSVMYEGVSPSSHAAGMTLWTRYVDSAYFNKSGADTWVQLSTYAAGGGIRMQQGIGNLKVSDYGSVAIRFRPTYAPQSNQFTARLTDVNGNDIGSRVYLDARYIPATTPFVEKGWYYFTIPMSDFGVATSTTFGGIRILSNVSTVFSIDDVRFVQKLSWVMGSMVRNVGGYRFGVHWLNDYCTSGYKKLHTGNDYSDYMGGMGGQSIYAASRGFVRFANPLDGAWGYAIVIQHESGFTTSYLHLDNPNLAIGTEVQRGTYLGTTTYLTTASHLHFGTRVADYNDPISRAGALPQQPCTMNSSSTLVYPAFPDRLIDSEKMNWK